MDLKYFIGMATDGKENGTTTFCLVELSSGRVIPIDTEDGLVDLAKKIPGGWEGKITFNPPGSKKDNDGLTIRYFSRLSPPVHDRFLNRLVATQ